MNGKSNNQQFLCQICQVLEVVVQIKSGSLNVQGQFCQPCAIVRLEKWYCWNEKLENQVKLKRGLELMNAQTNLS